ncbi:MAG: response regulator transcription factor [Candidatus Levybacteria bacterium]|nr:response regulator transcription factor [Candidatus Levybacteria bacterium]
MKKILIVDDDKTILEAIEVALRMEGYKTLVVADGNNAIQKADLFKPDVILLDLLLSGNDGREISKEIKKNKSTKNIPIIIMSAHPGIKKLIVEAGADDFLPKPFDIDDLLSVVKKHTA